MNISNHVEILKKRKKSSKELKQSLNGVELYFLQVLNLRTSCQIHSAQRVAVTTQQVIPTNILSQWSEDVAVQTVCSAMKWQYTFITL